MISVSIEKLCKSFTLHNQAGAVLPVLNNVDAEIHAGECVALHGPSGVGKSTLLKCVYANYRACSGAIRVRYGDETTDVVSAPPRLILALRATTMSYVTQFLRVIPRVPAIDVVAEPLLDDAAGDLDAIGAAREKAATLLARLSIPVRLWRLPPATFSGGEQQRINIARGLIKPRSVLLLDEPTASLDAENEKTVIDLINEARSTGAAVIGVFHDSRVRDAVATRTLDMAAFAP